MCEAVRQCCFHCKSSVWPTGTGLIYGWDGKHDSKNANSDVYVYILKYQLAGDAEEKVENGDITLIR